MPLSNRISEAARWTWSLLPTRIRGSAAAWRLRLLVSSVKSALSAVPPENPQPAKMRVIRSVQELDQELEVLDQLAQQSDDARRLGFAQFCMEPESGFPEDPWSPDYHRFVMDLYEKLSGRKYEVSNEVTLFDIDAFTRAPFPFNTESCGTVGAHLMTMGHLIRSMDLSPASRVLDMGFGWGNTTIALAQMGHEVTGVDVEPKFAELLRRRSEALSLPVRVICEDFNVIESLDEQFDAILFFESFHHSDDHLRLLEAVDDRLADGGTIFFAAEPIVEHFPVPWGLRMDGESLWAIRRNGWLELGFQRSYFEQTLQRLGYSVEVIPAQDIAHARVFVAQRQVR